MTSAGSSWLPARRRKCGGEAELILVPSVPPLLSKMKEQVSKRAALIHSALSKGHHQLSSLCPLRTLSPEQLGVSSGVELAVPGAVVLSCSLSRRWLGGEGQGELVRGLEGQGGATGGVTSLGCMWGAGCRCWSAGRNGTGGDREQ